MKKNMLLLACVFSFSLDAAAPLTKQQAIDKLSDAVQEGDVAKARELLEENEIDINATVRGGWTFLMDAAHRGHADTIELLVGVEGINVNYANGGKTALYWATRNGETDAVEKLTHVEGIELDFPTEAGKTPLMIAADCPHKEIVEILLQAGADKFKQNQDGQNAEAIAQKAAREFRWENRNDYAQTCEEIADYIRDYVPSSTKSAAKQ